MRTILKSSSRYNTDASTVVAPVPRRRSKICCTGTVMLSKNGEKTLSSTLVLRTVTSQSVPYPAQGDHHVLLSCFSPKVALMQKWVGIPVMLEVVTTVPDNAGKTVIFTFETREPACMSISCTAWPMYAPGMLSVKAKMAEDMSRSRMRPSPNAQKNGLDLQNYWHFCKSQSHFPCSMPYDLAHNRREQTNDAHLNVSAVV